MLDAVVSIEEPRMSEGSARADALLQLVQDQGTVPPPHASAHWISYGGGEAIPLAIVLLVVAGGFAYGANGCALP